MRVLVNKLASRIGFAALVAVALFGCSPLYVDWDRHTVRTVPQAQPTTTVATYTRTETSYAAHKPSSHPKKHKQNANATGGPQPPEEPDVDEMSIEPGGTTATSAETSGSTISMVTADDSSATAEKSIDATSQRLARFHRNQLNGPALAAFDQANAFLNQGKQAIAEKDYVAASGFAHKASLLADKIQTTPLGQ